MAKFYCSKDSKEQIRPLAKEQGEKLTRGSKGVFLGKVVGVQAAAAGMVRHLCPITSPAPGRWLVFRWDDDGGLYKFEQPVAKTRK